jgi:hypothetical protein
VTECNQFSIFSDDHPRDPVTVSASIIIIIIIINPANGGAESLKR